MVWMPVLAYFPFGFGNMDAIEINDALVVDLEDLCRHRRLAGIRNRRAYEIQKVPW